MSRADAWLAALALALGLGWGACFGSNCIDESSLDYSLTDSVYTTEARSIGDYAVDDRLELRVDPDAETITLSFSEDGRPIEVRYDVARIDLPE